MMVSPYLEKVTDTEEYILVEVKDTDFWDTVKDIPAEVRDIGDTELQRKGAKKKVTRLHVQLSIEGKH